MRLRESGAFGMLPATAGTLMKKYICIFVAFAAALLGHAAAADEAADAKVKQFLDGLHFQSGTVNVSGAHATLALTPEFRYLDAADAQKVLTQLWNNPPDTEVLGMLVPTAAPLSDPARSWAVAITYSDDGHIADADAAKLDYEQMLKDMQSSMRDANPERKKQGYSEIELVGWAARPHYDATANKLYWAKELSVSDGREHALNYDIRALGRGGYLSLNAVAGIKQFGLVESEMQKVLAMTTFDAGARYGDFNASTDKVAAYGIGALVAGAIAAKAGLFAKLIVLLIAFKKAFVIGFLAVAAAVRKFFTRAKS